MFYPYNENMDIICITQYNLYRTLFTFQRPTIYIYIYIYIYFFFFILTFLTICPIKFHYFFLKKIFMNPTQDWCGIGQFDGICCIRSSLRLPAKDMELFKILHPLDWLNDSLSSPPVAGVWWAHWRRCPVAAIRNHSSGCCTLVVVEERPPPTWL